MRIVGGDMGGRRLFTLDGNATRPTSDRVKEALFSILGGRLDGGSVLDMFAGSGALALEALSRGADEVCLIDSSRAAGNVIKRNIAITGCEARARFICADWRAALSALRGRRFDLVLMDPPYAKAELYSEPLAELAARGLLAEGAIIVLEHSSGFAPEYPTGYSFGSLHKYRDTSLTLLSWHAEGDADT